MSTPPMPPRPSSCSVWRAGLAGVATAMALGTLGCGAKVVIVDDDGGEGGASSGATATAKAASAASTASATATSTAVSTTSGFITPCTRLCMDHAECLGGADCLANCMALTVPGCEPETDQYVLCLAHNFGPNCELGTVCDGELAVYDNCVTPTIVCQDVDCEIEPGLSCGCTGICETTTLSQRCTINDDFFQCECEADGVPLGFCTQRLLECSLDTGCCKPMWLLTQE